MCRATELFPMVLLNVLHKVVQTFKSAVYGILQSRCTLYSIVFLIAINKGKVVAFFFSKKSPLTCSVQIRNGDTLELCQGLFPSYEAPKFPSFGQTCVIIFDLKFYRRHSFVRAVFSKVHFLFLCKLKFNPLRKRTS